MVLSLLASAAIACADEAWKSETAATCSQKAWTLTVLGAIGIGVILALGGASISHNELNYRNLWWRLSWWASCLSLLVGVLLFKIRCGGPPFEY